MASKVHVFLTFGAVSLLLTGCGGAKSASSESQPTGQKPLVVSRAPSCVPGSVRPLGSSRAAYAAVVRSQAVAYRRPGLRPFARFGRRNVNGVPSVFGVLAARVDRACAATWYRVQLPMRPNGVTGWVRAADVRTGRVATRIRVDLSERRLTFFRRGRPVLRVTVAIGSRATPTPLGRYYVNQRLVPADPSGPFGPGAIGISAFSEVLTGWTQGGPIAIHGTNRPDSIGRAVSNGCIRVNNRFLRRLFAATPAGTPVDITS
jgi:lipoprotein-anchoring transpeptidase ErfK/SrfK